VASALASVFGTPFIAATTSADVRIGERFSKCRPGWRPVKHSSWFLVLLIMCQPAVAGQRILLIRGLMDYVPGISPMSFLRSRLTDEGYEVTMITHLNDGFYKNQYWDAVIGHSQGAISALREARDLARYNPKVTIIAVDPPRTSELFHCVPDVRYLDLHTGEFGLGGGSLSCPQAQNVAMGGLHITLPMRSDTQEQIVAYLRQDAPIEMAYAEPTDVSFSPIKPKLSLPPINPKPCAVYCGAGGSGGSDQYVGPPVIPWTERSYAWVLDPKTLVSFAAYRSGRSIFQFNLKTFFSNVLMASSVSWVAFAE